MVLFILGGQLERLPASDLDLNDYFWMSACKVTQSHLTKLVRTEVPDSSLDRITSVCVKFGFAGFTRMANGRAKIHLANPRNETHRKLCLQGLKTALLLNDQEVINKLQLPE